MCEYSAIDGYANDWHLVHLGTRAVGGAGLVFSEAAAVSEKGRITVSDLGIWSDEHIAMLIHITHFIGQQGAVAGIQLAHSGRKGSHQVPWAGGKQISPESKDGWLAEGPSPIPFSHVGVPPKALSQEAIAEIVDDFKHAARRALQAGFEVLEIHAAHGYLIHEFLSPISNLREDAYGGSFEHRIRFLQEIVTAVQEVWPSDLPLFVRISATEYTQGGWDMNDSIRLSAILLRQGVDLVDCSSGGNVEGVKIALKPGYQVEFADQIKRQTGTLTGAVGLITEPVQADEIIRSGKADLVFLARQLLRDPYFPLRAAHELGHEVAWPKQYERAVWR